VGSVPGQTAHKTVVAFCSENGTTYAGYHGGVLQSIAEGRCSGGGQYQTLETALGL
jgi:hypothetical protein